MFKPVVAAVLAASIGLPTLAQAQSVRVPVVRIPATVTGTWVLNPAACPDIREDFRDARYNSGRADRREDRRDQRVINCPSSAYTFVPTPGQAPNKRIKVGRDGTARFLEPGEPAFGNRRRAGVAITAVPVFPTQVPQTQVPTYQQPAYQAPTYVQPQYQTPQYQAPTTTYQAPATTYQTPTYAAPTTPTYQTPTYQQPSYQSTTTPTYQTQPTYQSTTPSYSTTTQPTYVPSGTYQ